MALNDQFEMSRIPIKPLAYSNKELADFNEFMIDYLGPDPKYHLFIVDSSDRTKIIDLTQLTIDSVNDINNIKVHIDGVDDPIALEDLLNWFYKNFLFPRVINDSIEENKDIILDPSTSIALLIQKDNSVYAPVTRATYVFDSNGVSVEDRLNQMTKVGFSMDYLTVGQELQSEFVITYPFSDYRTRGNFIDIRIGTVFIDRTRYTITDNDDHITAVVKFDNTLALEKNRRIDILYIYNVNRITGDGDDIALSGYDIAIHSIPIEKMYKSTDDYYKNDPEAVASAKAVYNLYTDILDLANTNANKIAWCMDNSSNSGLIDVSYSASVAPSYPMILNIITNSQKVSTVRLTSKCVVNGTTHTITNNVQVYNTDNSALSNGFPANRLLKIIVVSSSKAYALNVPETELQTSRYIYKCKDQDTVISYSNLSYTVGSLIYVYRNGVRLFDNYDYHTDKAAETITLFVRAEETETIVFESINI